jgi:hypothetical protein
VASKSVRAYIAGFLDGDGSIIFQIVRRLDYRLGFQIRASICFYQNKSGIEGLRWLTKHLCRGTIRERAGRMCDLTIVGTEAVAEILIMVRPFVIFKRRQVEAGIKLISVLSEMKRSDPGDFQAAADLVDRFARLNYSKNRTITAHVVREHLALQRREANQRITESTQHC